MMIGRYLLSARSLIATIVGAFLFGFAAGKFMPPPGLDFDRDEALVFIMICALASVWLGVFQSLVNRRIVTVLRALGDDLKQTSKQIGKDAGASR